MGYDEIRGALATLRRLPQSKALWERFKKPELHREVGLQKAPEYDFFRELLDDADLIVWKIRPEGAATANGLAMFATFDGPPFVALHFDSGKVDLDLARDVLLALVPVFFTSTDEPALFFYVPKPVDPDVHDALLEGGFDLFDDNPTLDPDESCFVLERYTYDAYYGAEVAGGREGEFDDYENAQEDSEGRSNYERDE